MIRLEGIEKAVATRPSPTFLLRRINLEVDAGDFVTIMGPSGAGKTTLLTILGMLDGDFTGEYWFGDTGVHALSARDRGALARTAVGFVFQHYHLLDELTVAEEMVMLNNATAARARAPRSLAEAGRGRPCPPNQYSPMKSPVRPHCPHPFQQQDGPHDRDESPRQPQR